MLSKETARKKNRKANGKLNLCFKWEDAWNC